MEKESLSKQAVQKKPLWVKIFVRICVFLMAFSLIWVYIAYMFTPAQNIDEANETNISEDIDNNETEDLNISNEDATSEISNDVIESEISDEIQ